MMTNIINVKTPNRFTLVFSLMFLFSFGIFIHSIFADTVTSTISLGSFYKSEYLGVNPNTNTIYAPAASGNEVFVIDGATNTISTTVSAGIGPTGVGVNPSTNLVYITNNLDNTVSVIDGTNNSVVNTISVGSGPWTVGVNPTTNKIYVIDHQDGVDIIDGTTNGLISKISTIHPNSVGVNPTTNMIYVTNFNDNSVSVIDGTTNSVTDTIAVGSGPWSVGVNPTTNKVYVANINDNSVSVIDGTTNSVTDTIAVGSNPNSVGVNPTTNKIYVSSTNDNSVSVIDGTTNSVTDTIAVGSNPHEVGVNPTTNKIYVDNFNSYTISVISGSTPINTSDAPTNLSTNVISSSQIDLTWTAPSNNGGSEIAGYQIDRSNNGGSTWSTVVSNTSSNATTYSDTGLAHSTTYSYRVSSINSIGTSLPSNVASATTLNVEPSSPTSLTATGKITHIDLTWIAPSDNGGTPILGYAIQRSTDNGITWSTITQNTNSTGTTYTDSHLMPVRTYSYQVSAINSVGMSDSSNIVSTKPLSTPHLVSVSKTDEIHSK